MAKAIVTRDSVYKIAQEIVCEGDTPSIIAVQQRIGAGSYTTVKRFLDDWQQEEVKNTQVLAKVPEKISAKGVDLVNALWAEASQITASEVSEIREKASVEAASNQNSLAEAIKEITRLEKIEDDQNSLICKQIEQLHELAIKVAGLESEVLRAKLFEQRLEDSMVAQITAEQQAAYWKVQAEQAGLLTSIVAELQKKIEGIPVPN